MTDMNTLINERTQAIEKLEAWVGTIEADGRDMTPEEVERYNTDHEAVGEITNRIERARQLEALRGLTPATDPQPAAGDPQGGELPTETVPGQIGLTVAQARQFNILRAVQATIDGDWRGAEFERECSQAVADQLGYGPRSFFVPTEVLTVTRPEMRQITKAGDGADLVGTEHLAGSFIDLLRNRAVVAQAGARMLTGLVGDLSIPRMASGTTGYWVAEDGQVTEANPVIDAVTLTARNVGAHSAATRSMLKQSDPSIQGIIMDDITRTLALAVDLGALHGAGTNEPVGIENVSGVGSVTAGAPTWAKMVEFETDVAVGNADIGAMAYITNAKMVGKLKITVKESGHPEYLMAPDGTVNGYRVLKSNQVKATYSTNTQSGVFFGNWNDLLIGMWGGLDMLIDPYTSADRGRVRIIGFQTCDVAVRHPVSFSFAGGLTH
jgi:HK97 family phage major capsid protein